METGLRDKVVLITGASGGIGNALARVFADEGAMLVLQGRSQFEALQAFVTEQGWQDRALCLQFDVTDRAATFEAVRTAAERFGRIDVCVANAGVWPEPDVPLHAMTEERVRGTVDTNLLGAVWTAQAFLDQLAERGPRDDGDGASLVFIGSTAGRFGERDHADYSMTKAGMIGLVRTLKNEIVRIDPYGRVNMVEPGWTVTPMARTALADDEGLKCVLQTLPMPQLGRALDIARTVAVLCSPKLSRHTSGEILTVSGGMEGRVLWERDAIDTDAVRRRIREES
jgi:3-oxoacyl-[acyl-carrier protein] reductase